MPKDNGDRYEFQFYHSTVNDQYNYDASVDKGTVDIRIVNPITPDMDPLYGEITYDIMMPDTIVTTNSDRITNQSAIWNLHDNPRDQLVVRSEFNQSIESIANEPTASAPDNSSETADNDRIGLRIVAVFGTLVLFAITIAGLRKILHRGE